jgi:glutamine synthetase
VPHDISIGNRPDPGGAAYLSRLKGNRGPEKSTPHKSRRLRIGSDVKFVGITYVDIAGVTRSKPLVNRGVEAILKDGFRTAKANLDANSIAPLTPGSKLNISQGDVAIIPDPETLVYPSYAPGTARFMGDVPEADGKVSALCARSLLKRVVGEVRSRGYEPLVGLESEFHLVREQGGHWLPGDTSGIQTLDGYNEHRKLLEEITAALDTVGVRPLKVHTEGGRGQMEIDLAHEPALKATDGFYYFKEVVKTLARDQGLVASFMPKIGADWWGSGLHVHLNLAEHGRSAFAGVADKRKLGLSELCYFFIGGVLKHAKGLCAIAAPTVNSYKRLLPGRWNADAMTYGPGNRGSAVRIPDERGKATRIELRMPDNACNLYLMLACALSAGMEGIEKKLDPGEPLLYDASAMTDRERIARGLKLMPRSLGDALAELEKDKPLRRVLGPEMFEEFLAQRYFEVAQAADQVTPWEVSHFVDLF